VNGISKRTSVWVLIGLAAVLGFSACGDDGDGGASAAGGGAETVSVESIGDAGDVLVDSSGAALYTPEQEADGEILCTARCTSIWVPVTVGNGKTPNGPSEINSDLGTVERPDGTTQVTFGGAPLYSFSEEGPGEVTGDGFEDAFDGQQFTWRVVTAAGVGSDSGDSGASGSTGGGYSY
jgi:predicted lipoprotein with Yx(FWY)xxD motif